MQDSVYNGAFGALTQSYRLDLITNNLANADTVSFKREKTAFEDVLTHYAHDYMDPNRALSGGIMWPEADEMTQPRISESKIAFVQGEMQQTGNPLDLAIDGEGFFRVRTPEGEFLTRDGRFTRSAQGNLVTLKGYEVLGQDGPLTLPEQGRITVNGGGRIEVGGNAAGTIDLVTVNNLSRLEKRGENLYRMPEDGNVQTVPAEEAAVVQGTLEQSNVKVVEEMVRMIETLRMFEACQRAMTNTNEQDKNVISKLGTPR